MLHGQGEQNGTESRDEQQQQSTRVSQERSGSYPSPFVLPSVGDGSPRIGSAGRASFVLSWLLSSSSSGVSSFRGPA